MSDISLVVIGAGRILAAGESLPETSGLRLLLEADPHLVELVHDAKGELVQAALAPTGDTRPLRRFNLPRLSSLNEPADGLFELYPGVQDVESLVVDKLDPASLAERALKGAGQVRLIADAAGEENTTLALLDVLLDKGRLDSAEFFVGERALYEGGLGAAELMSALSERGMDVRLHSPGSSSRLPRISASPRMAGSRTVGKEGDLAGTQSELSQLQAELAAARQSQTAAQAEAVIARKAVEELREAQTILAKKYQAELKKATAAVENTDQVDALKGELEEKDAEIARLAEDLASAHGVSEKLERSKQSLKEERNKTRRLDRKVKKLEAQLAALDEKQAAATAELADKAKDLGERTDELAKASASRDALEEEKTNLSSRLAALEEKHAAATAELADKTKDADERTDELAKASASRDALEEEKASLSSRLAALNETLGATRQDQRLATRMQAIAQADLNDMREKYRQLSEAKARQDELLDKLVYRLSEAGEYFEKLQVQGALSEDDASTAIKKKS